MGMTPMMQQYEDAKASCPDALLLFRMGDFYELFHDDAKIAARVLGLALTSRDKGENAVPMAGFPHHQLETYLGKLIDAGHHAAVCDQVEDPKQAKGLVRREVTRVVTKGTVVDDALLNPAESNYLAAIVAEEPAGLAWIDISTGEFQAAQLDAAELVETLARIEPAELLIAEDDAPPVYSGEEGAAISRRPAWMFASAETDRVLKEHFGTKSMEGFGFEPEDARGLRAAGAVLAYLAETQRVSLAHVKTLQPQRRGTKLEIDPSTRRSLEISKTIRDGAREGSLLGILDRTVTAMGSRQLAQWLGAPLVEPQAISARLDAVEEFLADVRACDEIRTRLQDIYDVQRLLARIMTGRASPRDLGQVARTLAVLPEIKAKLAGRHAALLAEIDQRLDLCPEIRGRLEATLVEDPPLAVREGGLIREGVDARLDELRGLAKGGKQWIASYQAKQAEETGIPNLKVGFNKVFGYYLEVTRAHVDKVPDHFIRKQTIKSAERYITPELKKYEEKVISADEDAKTLEYELFLTLRDATAAEGDRLLRTAAALAELDVLASLADLARRRGYCRPVVNDSRTIRIAAGRHPVVDALEPEGTFVPNSTRLDAGIEETEDAQDGYVLLLTGPNMAGKSTYIRQVALISIMAQMGSFVPAEEAELGIVDRVYARVGASDELSRGQSTFMVEMTETARILNTATDRSLVILDEVGRGTSTYDGLSIAWSIVEFLHSQVRCRTLFATHYHELTQLAERLDGVRNYNVAVKEWKDQVVFLHQIVPGTADKSYAIYVARLAGVPAAVSGRAEEILADLEANAGHEPAMSVKEPTSLNGAAQLTLFETEDHPVLKTMRSIDLNQFTPIDSLNYLHEIQAQLKAEFPDKVR